MLIILTDLSHKQSNPDETYIMKLSTRSPMHVFPTLLKQRTMDFLLGQPTIAAFFIRHIS